MTNKKDKLRYTTFSILFLAIILLCWQAVVIIFKTPPYLYSSPLLIIRVLLTDNTIYSQAWITILESIAGFLLGSGLGFLIAIVLTRSKIIEFAVMPYAVLAKVTPIIAIVPLLIIWFGTGIMTKIICAAIICFFPVLVNSLQGFQSIDKNLIRLFESYGSSRLQKLRQLEIPASLPYLFASLKVSFSLALIGVIVGEFVCATQGLGFYILTNSYMLKTSQMLAGVFLTGIIGITFYFIIEFARNKLIIWNN
jgi:NitT/TauT family transport system permease protein